MRIKYKNIYVIVDAVKATSCDCCAKIPDPRGLHNHHWIYEFTVDEVRKTPELALKNKTPLCFRCHRVGNALRIIEENKELVKILKKLRYRDLE